MRVYSIHASTLILAAATQIYSVIASDPDPIWQIYTTFLGCYAQQASRQQFSLFTCSQWAEFNLLPQSPVRKRQPGRDPPNHNGTVKSGSRWVKSNILFHSFFFFPAPLCGCKYEGLRSIFLAHMYITLWVHAVLIDYAATSLGVITPCPPSSSIPTNSPRPLLLSHPVHLLCEIISAPDTRQEFSNCSKGPFLYVYLTGCMLYF